MLLVTPPVLKFLNINKNINRICISITMEETAASIAQEFLKHFGKSLKVVCSNIELKKVKNRFLYLEYEQGFFTKKNVPIAAAKLTVDRENNVPGVHIDFAHNFFEGHDDLIRDFFRAFVEKYPNFRIDVDWERKHI